MIRIYIAGPMTAIPQYNVPAFQKAEKDLNKLEGIKAVLPADLNEPKVVKKLLACPTGTEPVTDLTWPDLLAEDLKIIGGSNIAGHPGVDWIAVLPGWQYSKGARLETFFGRLLNKRIVYYPHLKKVPRKSLESAHAIR